MKKNIFFSILNYDLSSRVYLPYVYGAIRSYSDNIPEIVNNYKWHKPYFRLNTIPIEDIVLSVENPDIVALSCNVWNLKKQLKFGELVKKRFPNCLIVLGGNESPKNPEDFFNKYDFIDILVRGGDGEKPFSEILLENLKDKDWSKVRGIAYKKNNEVQINPPAERIPDLESIESPYLKGYLDFAVDEIHRDNLKPAAVIESSRGCPYSCTFCDWGSNTMSRVRKFSLDRVFKEIEWLGENKVNEVMFGDANFGIFPRDLEFAKKLVEVNKKTSYPKKAHIAFAKNTNQKVMEIGTLLAEYRLFYGVTLSVQSLNQEALDAVHRKNIKLQNYKDLIYEFNLKNIPIYSDVILGLPQETKESFTKGVSDLFELGVHTGVTLFPLSVLENSQMSDPEYLKKYGIETVSRPFWPSFPLEKNDCIDKINLVVKTNTMSRKDWLWCRVFIDLVQAFHIGGWTRYISIYLNNNKNINYDVFYTKILNHFSQEKNTVIGKLINSTFKVYGDFLVNENLHEEAWQDFFVDYQKKPYKFHGTPFHQIWIGIAAKRKEAFTEIKSFVVDELKINLDKNLINDLFRFQDEFVFSMKYDGKVGKKIKFKYNFLDHFYKNAPLIEQNNLIEFKDTHTGLGNINELDKPTDFRHYIKNACSNNVRHAYFYLHQIDKCSSVPISNTVPQFLNKFIGRLTG